MCYTKAAQHKVTKYPGAPVNLQLLAQRLLALRVLVVVLVAQHLLVLYLPRVLHHLLQLQLHHQIGGVICVICVISDLWHISRLVTEGAILGKVVTLAERGTTE